MKSSLLRSGMTHWGVSLWLLWTAVALCHAEGSIHNISLSMDGLLNVTDQSVIAVVCRVTYNSSQLSTFFYLANTRLSGSTAFEADSTVRVSYYQQCYQPPSQDNCEELTLVLRVSPQLNNTVITCRSRPRDSTTMTQSRSQERITVVLKDPAAEMAEPPACSSPPSPSPSPSPSPHPPPAVTFTTSSSSPSPTPTPEVDPETDSSENKSPSVLPEGKERVYVVALAAESVLLIATILAAVFLLVLYCKNRKTKVVFDLVGQARSISPEPCEGRYQLDNKTTTSHTVPRTSSAPDRPQDTEPRYTQCSHV